MSSIMMKKCVITLKHKVVPCLYVRDTKSCDIQPWIVQKALLTCKWLRSPLYFTAWLTTSTQHQIHKLCHYHILFRLHIKHVTLAATRRAQKSAAGEIGQDIKWQTGLCMRLLSTLRYTLGITNPISRETMISSKCLVPQLPNFTAWMVCVKQILSHYNNSDTGLFVFQLYSIFTVHFLYLQHHKFQELP